MTLPDSRRSSRHLSSRRTARPHFGLARVLSKMGYCSRAEAWRLIKAGRVTVNGTLCRDAEAPVDLKTGRIAVDGQPIVAASKVYLMLNKPHGLITSRSDEQGRDTVYRCFADQGLPWLAPVGRLDKASEGLILFTNDTAWGDRILSPERGLEKTYHVQMDSLASPDLLDRLGRGLKASDGAFLSAKRVSLLRQGTRNSWLEIILDEGKNRHIRRLLEACDLRVLRLIRVAIGPLTLGPLPKGAFRHLTEAEVASLAIGGRT